MCVCVFIYFVYIYNGAYLINVKHTFIRHTIQSVELFIDIVYILCYVQTLCIQIVYPVYMYPVSIYVRSVANFINFKQVYTKYILISAHNQILYPILTMLCK